MYEDVTGDCSLFNLVRLQGPMASIDEEPAPVAAGCCPAVQLHEKQQIEPMLIAQVQSNKDRDEDERLRASKGASRWVRGRNGCSDKEIRPLWSRAGLASPHSLR